jgi:hypothetical protein
VVRWNRVACAPLGSGDGALDAGTGRLSKIDGASRVGVL